MLLTVVGVVLGIIVLIGVLAATYYNQFVTLRNKSDEAFSTMDVYLKKRYDLIPNLVETVKGYATHEQETLERVTQARNMAIQANNFQERQQQENMLSGTLKSLFALSENYPDLKANTNFLDLQNQLQKLEEDIAQSRKYYNGVVKVFNTKIQQFPSNIAAMLLGFHAYPYFMADMQERENVQVRF